MRLSVMFIGVKTSSTEEGMIAFTRIYIYIYIYIYIHSPTTLLGTPVQLLGNTNC